MLPGSLIAGDVRQLETYAIVNGVRRDIESFTQSSAFSGDLPDQVATVGGVAGSSGTIAWANGEDVQDREPSPWHKAGGWPPSPGDRVKVYVTDGATTWPRFTGALDVTSGAVGGGMQSTVIDDKDVLNVPFTHEAILRHNTPFGEGNAYRSIGLNHWYFLTAALRAAGLFNTPPMVAEIALSVPMQGSVWPEAGLVTSASGNDGSIHATFYRSDWGYAAADFIATYQPRTGYSASDPLQITMLVAKDHTGTYYSDVQYTTGQIVRFRVSSDRGLIAYWNDGTVWTTVVNTGESFMTGAITVTLLVKDGVWTLRADNGQVATGSQAVTGGTMLLVRLTASSGSRVAGVQVSRPNSVSHEFASLSFTPSMRFVPGNIASTMDMSPRLENRNVAELVDEICKATLTAAWFDESGVFQLRSSDQLRSADPVQTITTLDDITQLGWEDSLLSIRSSVEVTWKDAAVSKSRYLRKELFRGAGDSMESADNVEVFATPDESTEWFGVDRSPRLLNDSNWGLYNRKRGSFMGVYYMNASDVEVATSTSITAITVQPLGTVAVKISHAAGTYGTGIEANLGTSENAAALRAQLRGQNLPVVRGCGDGKWMSESTTSLIAGASYAPALTHDLGYWGHRFFEGGSVALRIADHIASMVTEPLPTLSGISVLYDPRRQLADVVTIESGLLDVTMRALIVGIAESHAMGNHEQTLTVRIISVTSSRKITYAELEAAWAGSNYAAMQSIWAGLTYADFENDPLEGAPNQ